MKETIENKVVIVTGGASGIGLSIVDIFVKNGAKLVIIVDINEEIGIKAVKNIEDQYGNGKTVFYKCDVTKNLGEVFEKITTEYKYIDVLLNNAGTLDEKSTRNTININVTSLMEWSVKFYDYLRKDRNGNGGTIINISSLYGLKITPFTPLYHGSKFAVIGFTKSLGHEYNFKRSGVRVVAVCPGYTHTQLTANLHVVSDDVVEDFIKEAKSDEWQEVDAVGKGVKVVLENAESGTVWLIVGSRPAQMV